MTGHDTLERIARQLCESAGRDYDRKGCKRAHWRKEARRVAALANLLATPAPWERKPWWRRWFV